MRTMTPEDLYEIAWVGDCDLAPGGGRVAFTVTRLDRETDGYRSAIWVVDVDGGAARQFTAGAKRDSVPRWSPDGRRLAFLSERDEEKPQLYVIPTDGGEAQRLTNLPFGASAAAWSPDGTRIAFAARAGGSPDPDTKKAKPYRRISHLKSRINGEGWTYDRRRHLFVVAADGTAPATQITDGDWDDTSPSWSPDGAMLAFTSARHDNRDHDDWSDAWSVPASGGGPTRLTATDRIVSGTSWSPDGTSVAFLARSFAAGGNATLHAVDASGGLPRPVDPAFDRQSGVGPSSVSAEPPKWLPGGLLTAAEDRGETSLLVSGGGPTRWFARSARTVQSYSADASSGRVAYTASRPGAPAEVFVADLTTGTERQLTTLNRDWLANVTLSSPEKFSITVDPGVEVDCWVQQPAVFEDGRSYPVLLNVHGGPFTQYGESFFDEFHVYTGAGYGVVYCNPRGSSGQTTEFGRAIVGRLGGPDYADVMAAFEAALERMPWADRSRLGVLGGSYGGFMTSWIIGHDHRFAAACSERAVNDWYTMQGTSDIGSFFNPNYLGEQAVIEDDLEAVLRQSPLTYAREIHTPVLILHSEDDLRCPVSQAEQLFVVLKRLGREVEFVRFPDENHELSRSGRPSHRVDRFNVILEWFGRKLGGA